jgi:hypothetical protein
MTTTTEATTTDVAIPAHLDSHRIANRAVLRSALFRAANKNQARTWYRLAPFVTNGIAVDRFTGEPYRQPPPFVASPYAIKSLEKVDISYAGEELRQDDLSVALHLAYLAQGKGPRERLAFKPYAFIQALGWSDNRESVRRLGQSIIRMGECQLTADSKLTGAISGRKLIQDYEVHRDARQAWWVELGSVLPTMLASKDRFDYIRESTRRHLPDFAAWLYGFISTQNRGERFEIPLATLFRIAGLPVVTARDKSIADKRVYHENRRKVREAMELLSSGRIEVKPRGKVVADARQVKQALLFPAGQGLDHDLLELAARAESAKVVEFVPGVAADWVLNGSTLRFTRL